MIEKIKRAIAEDLGGTRRLGLSLAEEETAVRIDDYKRDILKGQLCSAVLKMHFIKKDGKEWLYYETGGFVSLKDHIESGGAAVWSMLELLRRLTSALREAENMLLPTADFPLTPETVFIRAAAGKGCGEELRLLWLPEPAAETLPRRLTALMEAMEQAGANPEWNLWSLGIRRELIEKNLGLRELQRLLDLKERAYSKEQRELAAEAAPLPPGEEATEAKPRRRFFK